MSVMTRLNQSKTTKESNITADIRKFLNFKRIFHWKQWQGPMSGMKGVSDIIGCWRGRFIAIEVKRPGGKLTKHQEVFINNVKRSGGIAFMAYSVQDVINELKEYL